MDQHYETLDPNLTVLEAITEAQSRGSAPGNDRGKQIQAARDLLASLLFRGADVHKRISVLSWGERARVSIARMLISNYDLIALDEPTNNLDVQSREAIESCLAEWKGTLVVVSHDRRFLEHTCNMIAAFNSGQVSVFPGTYGEWEEHRKLEAAQAIGPAQKQGHTVLELEHRLALLSAKLSEEFQSDEEKVAIEEEFLATARTLNRLRQK
jgi:macrolide transport system ATP-binding/permease protein